MDNTSNQSSSFHISLDTDSVCSCNICQVRLKLNDVVSCIEKGLPPMEAVRIALSIRSFLYPDILLDFFNSHLLRGSEAHARISGFLPKSTFKQEEEYPTASVPDPNAVPAKDPSPELQICCYYLLILNTIEEKRLDEVKDNMLDEAKERASASIAFIQQQSTVVNVDGIASKLYFYNSVFHEQKGQLAQIRGTLLALYQRAIQNHEELCRGRLVNLLLRNYLHYNHYHQAEKFRAAAFQPRSHMQLCQYKFYVGKIQTIRLEYSDAKESLELAAQLAPVLAGGFRIQRNKWAILVRLILGEIPAKSTFTQNGMKKALLPYYLLTNAVRKGDSLEFNIVRFVWSAIFSRDGTCNLVDRVRYGVIKNGLRNINRAYSRISVVDIARKLNLISYSIADVEIVVAKAIRDGIIDAKLDHANSWMISTTTEEKDVYVTLEPQIAFDNRIAACLEIHHKLVREIKPPAKKG